MSGAVKRAYRYRFYPTPAQEVQLNRTFGCVRLVYNMALEERTRRWVLDNENTSFGDTSAWLTGWKHSDELGFVNAARNLLAAGLAER